MAGRLSVIPRIPAGPSAIVVVPIGAWIFAQWTPSALRSWNGRSQMQSLFEPDARIPALVETQSTIG